MQRTAALLALLAGQLAHASASRSTVEAHDLQSRMAVAELDAKKVSEILTYGLDAVTTGISIFMEDPPDIEYGFETCQLKLWKLVEKVVPKEKHGSEGMRSAKEVWDKAFESAPDIAEDIMEFRRLGKTDKLVKAIKTIITTALEGLARALPKESKYFVALGDLIDGVGESWDEYTEGNTARAVEVIWKALRTSVDDCLPAHWASDETYQLVMGTVDGVISKLSEHVLDYKRRILNSKVCYKRSAHRERVRPSTCRPGFEWDQMALCIPIGNGNGADCLAACGRKGGMCESFCGQGRACCRRGYSKDPAECEGSAGYVDNDFTSGSSSDYHQCVGPGPNLAFTVKGAGVPALNGLYVRSGSHSGRPRYTKVHAKKSVMEWSRKRQAWRLFIDNGLHVNRKTLYKSAQDTATFPTAGWAAHKGASPVPRIVPYPATPAEGSLAQVNASALGLLAVGGRRPAFGSHPAACDVDSGFQEKSGDWCLAPCPAGFKATNGRGCAQVCGGKFPADGMGVCGTKKAELMIAMTEMVTMVASGAIESAMLIAEMKEEGVRADKLSETINVFIEMGKPFARPQCPVVPEDPVPSTPAIPSSPEAPFLD